MSSVVIDDTSLTAIANAIRSKNGLTTTYTPGNMAAAILAIPSGGGVTGLEYESGTYTPTSDIARPTISFSNTHSKPPVFIGMVREEDPDKPLVDTTANSNYAFGFIDYYQLGGMIISSSSSIKYAHVVWIYRGTSTTSTSNGAATCTYSSDNTGSSSSSYSRYWATETGFRPYSSSTSRYWRANMSYNWVAVWI